MKLYNHGEGSSRAFSWLKALVGAFNQVNALVGAFSVIVQLRLQHYPGQCYPHPAVCRNLCFVTYKREDLFSVWDSGDAREMAAVAARLALDKLSLNPLLLLSTWKDNTGDTCHVPGRAPRDPRDCSHDGAAAGDGGGPPVPGRRGPDLPPPRRQQRLPRRGGDPHQDEGGSSPI